MIDITTYRIRIGGFSSHRKKKRKKNVNTTSRRHSISFSYVFALVTFTKLNGREKNILANSQKLIPMRHGFHIFLIIFCLLIIKTGFLANFTRVFV